MADHPSPEETAEWQKRLASQANDRAWTLTERETRTPEEDDEMLQAAHAAMYFWKIVGTQSNIAHAAQLVAHVYALLEEPGAALQYVGQSQPFFLERPCAPWEQALAHGIAANVAAACGNVGEHIGNYRTAQRLIADLPDPEDRAILEATMRVIPIPAEDKNPRGASSP